MSKGIPVAMRGQPDPTANGNGSPKTRFVDPRYIVVPEREDAESLKELGFDAVCFSDLRGVAYRRVVIVWNAGNGYDDENARKAAGKASGDGEGAFSVHTLELRGLRNQTIAELFRLNGWTSEEFAEELDRAAEFRKPTPESKNGFTYDALSRADLGIIPMASVTPKPIDWLWTYRLARREMALVAGEGGLGKSQVLLKIAACISRGFPWPDGSGYAPIGRVAILSAEDDAATTIKPRLMALDADLGRIDLLKPQLVVRKIGEEPRVSHMSFQDLDHWERVLDRCGDVSLFIVDPLPSYLGRGVNDSKNNELREILEPFVDRVIRPRGICLLANSHLNKSANSRTPMERILGSVAYGNLARNVSFVARDPDDPGRRFFKQAKCNTAAEDLPAMAFRVETRFVVVGDGIQIETAIPVFENGPVDVDLNEALSGEKGPKRRGPAPVKTTKLAEWLFDFLHGRGPTFLGAIADAAGGEGLLGAHVIDTSTGKGRWKGFTALYEARKRIPDLPPPRDGCCVITSDEAPEIRSVSNAARWALRRQDSPY